jgi:hypothetical protein
VRSRVATSRRRVFSVKSRLDRCRKSGFEKGDANVRSKLEKDARLPRHDVSIAIAQRGLAKAKVSNQQRAARLDGALRPRDRERTVRRDLQCVGTRARRRPVRSPANPGER